MFNKKIYYRFDFQGYMFNRDSMESVGITALDRIVCCKVGGGFVKVLCEVPNYIDEDILQRAVKRYKVAKAECIGGKTVLNKRDVNAVYYVDKHNLHFLIGDSKTGLMMYLKGQSKYFLQNKVVKKRIKANVIYTPDVFEDPLHNDSYSNMDSICNALKKYF